MGRSNARRKALLQDNPNCIYCGDVATTEDHCPPRSIFFGRAWPEGYSFSACNACNEASSHDELAIALLAKFGAKSPPVIANRLHGSKSSKAQDSEFEALVLGVVNNHPGLVDEMLGVTNEQRWKAAKKLGHQSQYSAAYQDFHIVTIPKRLHDIVKRFAAKLAKSLYHKHTSRIFPVVGSIRLKWITNADLALENNWFVRFAAMLGGVPVLRRAGADLKDQFDYDYAISPAHDLAAFSVTFSTAVGMTIVMTTEVNAWERIESNAKDRGVTVNNVFTVVNYPP